MVLPGRGVSVGRMIRGTIADHIIHGGGDIDLTMRRGTIVLTVIPRGIIDLATAEVI